MIKVLKISFIYIWLIYNLEIKYRKRGIKNSLIIKYSIEKRNLLVRIIIEYYYTIRYNIL